MARKRAAEAEEDASGRWLTTYGDAITLLMAFFVMLYSMSSVNAEKFNAFVSGLEGPFKNKSLILGLLDTGAGVVGSGGASAAMDATMGAAPPKVQVAGNIADENGDGPSETEGDAAESVGAPPLTGVPDQLEEVRRELEEGLVAAGLPADIATYRRDEKGLVVSIAADNVLFDSGSSHVGGTGERIMAVVAGVLAGFSNDVLIEGHTDDVPLRRGSYTNWNLSTDRAVSVLRVLAEAHGFPQQRLGAVGYGEFRPRVSNDSPANRALNRRVDILVIEEGAATDG